MKAFRIFFLFLTFAGAGLSMASAQAAPQKITVHLDPAKTNIRWTLKSTFHNVHGTFALKGGLITIDPATGEAQGEVIVETETGQSGNKGRDAKMQKEVLESVKYPEAIFHPEKVTGELKSGSLQKVTISGLFTMHGSDHPLTLEMNVDLRDNDARATTHFVIPYVQWGMTYPGSVLMHVSRQVDVDIAAQGSVDGLR
ncbi:YceI family protein [Silvibacterium dinghuense]|uniref:YceI family protein n=1 Tax=Silvibacterium dinghuense TaxID=1560006 RepID=A0A4Q1SBT0_9BACT|nr:YceI family protein [Silvibacterium dinghuense]RXS94479.1 YceI family protein [Silvibacterium dinghuense]GGH15842.1 hypothetical protein GCM10011586_37240 [Silvibacterium dinghuense]